MDIARMSMSMSNASLASAVQLSLMKLQMNTGEELAKGMTEMMSTMAVEPGKGINIDATV